MNPVFLGQLPDDILTWRGTAAALAEKCNELLPLIGLPEDAGSANERLVRHYVQVGVLMTPERDGREALFDERHIRQFLTARYLLKDGWPLAKITELMRSTGIDQLTIAVPEPHEPTAAEKTLARLKGRATPKTREPAFAPAPARAPMKLLAAQRAHAADNGDDLFATKLTRVESAAGPAPTQTVLRQAAEITQRRMDLQANLTGLGNPTGQPVRRRTVQIELTPWCQVYVDTEELARLPTNTPELLGNALTQALHEERIHRGEKS
jgi:DNA-binding transcriptional MerR regulator